MLNVKCTAYVPCFLAPFMSNDKIVETIIVMAFSVAVACILVILCNRLDKDKEIEEET